eukprot:TRINITY_DN74118_c0_g1_i1.p1 TRINITY_DN74118_c0_g1~~TRINITY_DN74118_c0_g1_i1.p1  ORF type:complete len:449 (-),score=110.35 TRINITY_DN74118_c0_g1_i1:267-1613(-)
MSRAVRSGTSPDDWQGSVVSNLTQAGDAHRDASEKIASGITAIRRTNAEHSKQRDSVHGQFSQKIRNTEGLSQQLSSHIKMLRNTLEHTEWSLGKLKAATQELVKPMNLCKQRLALRQKRPKREMVYDPFQESLLAEEKELQVGRSKLSDAMQETQKLHTELVHLSALLEADLQDKQHSLDIDSVCVNNKGLDVRTKKLDKIYNRKDVGLRPVFPEIMATPRDPRAMTQGRHEERSRQLNTLRLVEAAVQLEQRAKERWQLSSEVMEWVSKQAQAVLKRTQFDMGAKIEHTELLRQELTKQRRVTEQTIQELQRCLGMATDKLNYLEKPMTANFQRTKIRSGRTAREATADEVSEALTEQRYALQGKKLSLQEQVMQMERTLEELQRAYVQIQEDIRDKEAALAIDRQCASCKNTADAHLSFGFARVGHGQRHFADTCSSKLRQVEFP